MARNAGKKIATLFLRRAVRTLQPFPRCGETRRAERRLGDNHRHPGGEGVDRDGRGMRNHDPCIRQCIAERGLATHPADRLVAHDDRAASDGTQLGLQPAHVLLLAHTRPAGVELRALQRDEHVTTGRSRRPHVDAESVEARVVWLAEAVAPQAPMADAVVFAATPVAVIDLVPVAHQRRLHDRLLRVGHP